MIPKNLLSQHSPSFCGLDRDYLIDGFKNTDDPNPLNLCTSSEKNDKSFLNLYIVLIQDDNGNGPSNSTAIDIYKGVNEYFSPFNIFFQRADQTIIIKDSDLKNFELGWPDKSTLFTLCRQKFDPGDGLVLYVFDHQSLPNMGFAGTADGIESAYSILRVNPIETERLVKVAIHEIGHNLGLAHTFHNNILSFSWSYPIEEPYSTSMELTNDPLCADRGDQICDTPSDPGWQYGDYNENTCQVDVDLSYVQDQIEEFYTLHVDGNYFTPVINVDYTLNTQGFEHNHMSYNHRHCRNLFTTTQAEVMNCTANNRSIFHSAKLSYDPIVIEDNQDITFLDEYIENHIIIESGGKLTLNGDIKLPYWAEIVVEPGGELLINNATLSGYLEDDFWNGIVVLGDYSLTNSGFVSIKNNSVIKNARKGIFSKDGGRYILQNSTFINNQIAIHQKNSARINLSKVENCSFVTEKMPNDYAWHILDAYDEVISLENTYSQLHGHTAFIILENSNSLKIEESFFNTLDDWSAENQGIGIILDNSDAAIIDNFFENQRVGIFQTNSPGNGMSNIKANKFINNAKGVQLANSSMSLVEDNTFTVPSPSLVFSDYTYGVHMDQAFGVDVLNNSFTSTVSTDVHYIASVDSDSELSNSIRYNRFGSSLGSAYRHIELHGDHTMLQVSCNDFEVLSSTEFTLGLETDAQLMNQGDEISPAGNKWSNLSSCNMSNETQLYKRSSANGYDYYSHINTKPDCISSGIAALDNGQPEGSSYCDIPSSDPCVFPCEITEIAIIREEIREIEDDPSITPLAAKMELIQPLMHRLLKLAQRDIIQLVTEQDSTLETLSYLDSLVVKAPGKTMLWSAIANRYSSGPVFSNYSSPPEMVVENYDVRSKITDSFKPLQYQVNQLADSKDDSQIGIKSTDDIRLRIFPNPAKHDLNISIVRLQEPVSATEATIQLVDMTGRIFIEYALAKRQNEVVIPLPFGLLGLFLVVYNDNVGNRLNERVLIMP